MTKQPSYRFVGFEDEWKEVKLGEILVERNEQISESEEYQLMSFVQGKGVVPKSDRYDRSFLVKDDKKNYKKTEFGDFIYSSNNLDTGSIGFNKTGKALISPVYSIFYSKTKKESQFIAILSQRKEFINEMIKYRQGVVYGQFRIHESDFLNISILAPESNEQEALINFFQDIDQLISLQQHKLEVLKEQKKTYLKLFFPAKGQTKPALRFAEFEDEWKEVKLGEVTELKRGLTYKPTSVVENGTRVLRSSNIDGDVFKKQEDDIFVEDSSVTIPYVQFGDILITAANGSSKLVGKHAIIEDSEKMVHGGFMLLARSKQYKFLNALLSSEWYSRFINVSVAGGNGAIGNLSKSNLEKEIVLCPTIPEQEAIGAFFQDLDKAISKQEEKVNQLKESKQTLLRKMFI